MAGQPSESQWHDLFVRMYPADLNPADWAFIICHCKTAGLDTEDTAFMAAIDDMTDRVGMCLLTPDSVVSRAYSTYFETPKLQRTYSQFEMLVKSILANSRQYRKSFGSTSEASGLVLLEIAAMLDARNNSTINVNSIKNLLATRLNMEGWKRFKQFASCISEVISPTAISKGEAPISLYQKARLALGMKSSYRPLHIARVLAVLMNNYPEFLNNLFGVDEKLLQVFQTRLPLRLAAVAACQCAKVPRTASVYAFLSAVADDRLGFLQLAAGLSSAEIDFCKHYFYFGPNRIVESTTPTGLFKNAFATYRLPHMTALGQ